MSRPGAEAGGSDIWYPSGRHLTYGYDGAGRVDAASGQMGSTATNYTSASVQPAISYWPHGAVNTLALGNGLTETTTYNNRLQAQQIQAGSLLTLVYGYGTANNGNVQSQTITRGGSAWAQPYGYDGVNRLTSASEAGSGAWSEGYGYDAFGNRWLASRSGLPGVTAETPTGQSWYANTPVNNQVVGWGYDGAGNLANIAGGVRSSTYDAENRMTAATETATTTNYAYDGDGRRVMKTSGSQTTVYVYDASGNLAAEYGSSASASGTECLTADALGSTRLVTDANGAAVRCYDYLPFGEEIASGTAGRSAPCFTAASPDTVSEKFSGKERDAETGLDYFGARYYSGGQGRFTSPDPVMSSGRASDPQSWNRYAYARNNPLLYVDPTGTTYQICDTQGNCEDNYSDKDFRKNFQKSNNVLLINGNVYSRNANGTQGGQIGTYAYTGQELDQKGSQVVGDLGARADATNGLIATVAGASVVGGAAVAAAPAVGAAIAKGVATTVGWGYGVTGGTGVVLGGYNQYPNYIDAARSIGANVYNIPGWLWNGLNDVGQAWTANRAFLDASIARGQQFYLSTAPVGTTGAFAQELQYLTSKGIGPSQWSIIPLPF
jgi:RHS repeat-associated protein